MVKKNQNRWLIVGGIIICVILGGWRTVLYPKQVVKQALCAESAIMCRCYENIVDYRMTHRDVSITYQYQSEMKKRGFVSPLEFASIEEVQRINAMLSVCKMEQAQQVVPVTRSTPPVQPDQQQK